MPKVYPTGTSKTYKTQKHTHFAVLCGREADLDLLTHYFTNDACKVVRDDTRRRYILRSARLELPCEWAKSSFGDGEIEQNELMAEDIAENLVTLMNGTVTLQTYGFKPVSVEYIGWDEETGVHVTLSDHLAAHPRPPEDPIKRALPALWLQAGVLNENVKLALCILASQPVGWTSLYLLYELIKRDVGTLPPAWVSKKEAHAFTATANHSRVLADGMRHAKTTPRDWTQEQEISLSDARGIIFNVMKEWIDGILRKVNRM